MKVVRQSCLVGRTNSCARGFFVFPGNFYFKGKSLAASLGVYVFLATLLLGNSASALTLAWDPSVGDDIAGYKVYYGSAPQNYTNVLDVGNATQATIAGLVAGSTYYFAVVSYDSYGVESDFSPEISYLVPAAPAPPTGPVLQLSITANKTAVLSGQGQPGTVYEVQCSADCVHWNVLGTTTSDGVGHLQFIDPTPATQKLWFYRLRQVGPAAIPSLQMALQPDRTAVLTAQAVPGVNYDVLVSTDYLTWTLLGRTIAGTNGVLRFVDVNAPARTLSFYKLRLSVPAAMPKLRLSLAPDKSAVLTAQAQPGASYYLLGSFDMITWTSLGVATADSSGVVKFSDPAAATHPLGYYTLAPQ